MTPLRIERYSPIVVGFVLAYLSHFMGPHLKAHATQDLGNSIITILAINTGFLAAALTILLTAQGVESIQKLKTVNHFDHLINYHWQGILAGFIAGILSLAVILACKTVDHPYQQYLFLAWVLAVGWAFSAFLLVIYILKTLLRN